MLSAFHIVSQVACSLFPREFSFSLVFPFRALLPVHFCRALYCPPKIPFLLASVLLCTSGPSEIRTFLFSSHFSSSEVKFLSPLRSTSPVTVRRRCPEDSICMVMTRLELPLTLSSDRDTGHQNAASAPVPLLSVNVHNNRSIFTQICVLLCSYYLS